MTVIPITQRCPVCEKETPMPSGYVELKDGAVLCFTCKQCYVAQIHEREGGNVNAEMTVEEYKSNVCMVDLGSVWLHQKEGLFDADGQPLRPIEGFVSKHIRDRQTIRF